MKNSSDTFGIRIRDLPACSAVPQPTAPPSCTTKKRLADCKYKSVARRCVLFHVLTLTNQNYVPEEIKSRLRSGNACYHSVQNLLSSRLLSKNLKIKIYRTIILLVVLYGCETWTLTLREERKLRVFENMVLRRIFGPRRDEVTGVMEETA